MRDKKKDKFVADCTRLREQKMAHIDKRLRPFAIENAKRRPCSICGNLVMPDKFGTHMIAFHDG